MIRPYKKSDKPKLIELCREFWESSSLDLGSFDYDHTSQKLDHIISTGACIVSDNVDGFILLVESTNLCNSRSICAEVAWYVTPSARGGLGIKLLDAAIRYCQIKGVSCLSMMFMQSSMPESIEKIYGKLGFELRETTYVKRI